MPRNVEENVYVTIAFTRVSSVWKQLQREATDLDIPVAHLIKVLLADRTAAMAGHGKQLWFPRDQMTAQPSVLPLLRTEPSAQPKEDEVSRRAAAAASATSYWDD
jgi:hypothetical protein